MGKKDNNFPYSCGNSENNKDCKSVEKRFDFCELCNAVWKERIIIKCNSENPHAPDMYKEAIEQFKDEHWKRWNEDPYSIGLKLISTHYIYYNFGDDNYWEYKFRVIKQ